MARASKWAHLKLEALEAFKGGLSLSEAEERWADVPRTTLRGWRDSTLPKTEDLEPSSVIRTQFGQKPTKTDTLALTGVKRDPPPTRRARAVPELSVINGGKNPIKTESFRGIWERLQYLLQNPGFDGKEAIAAAQVVNSMMRLVETDQRLAEALTTEASAVWTEEDELAYQNWDSLPEDERSRLLSEALLG